MSDDREDIFDQLASAGKTLLGFAKRIGETDVKTAGEELLAQVAGEPEPEAETPPEAEAPVPSLAVVRPLRPVPLEASTCEEPKGEGR